MYTNTQIQRLRKIVSSLVILTMLFGGLAQPATNVAAAGAISVDTNADNTTDDNLCTLREAITNINDGAQTYDDCATGAGADTITFAANYTITLTSALPDITTDVTIDGNGAANTIVQASTCDPTTLDTTPCTPADWRVFSFTAGTSILKDMTVRYGNCDSDATC